MAEYGVFFGSARSGSVWEILKSCRMNLRLRVIRQKNHGQYRAINTALSQAQGDIVISCDADMILHPLAIEELMRRHEVERNLLLLGFRNDRKPDDPALRQDVLEQTLSAMVPEFTADNRLTFHWPGWPDNLCVATEHLQRLTGTDRLWVTEENTPDGDWWSLPRMVYGCLFSLPKNIYRKINGFSEELRGWGWGDTYIGALAYSQGVPIVPVYSACGIHVAHPDRSATKWPEARHNYSVFERALAAPLMATDSACWRAAAARITEQKELRRCGRTAEICDLARASTLAYLEDPARRSHYLLALGRFDGVLALGGLCPALNYGGRCSLAEDTRKPKNSFMRRMQRIGRP